MRQAFSALAFSALATFTAMAGLAPQVQAQAIPLDAVADTYLKQGSKNQNQGDETSLRIRSSGKNRSLVLFDPAAVAAAVGDGTLVVATLELFIESNSNNWGSTGRTVDVHRLTAPWTELGATWNCPDDADPGNSSPDCAAQWDGGGFEAAASDTVLHTNGQLGSIAFDVTADVASFLEGGSHHGWIVKLTNEGQSGSVDYVSREGAGPAPRLVLEVEGPVVDPTPPSLAITAPALPTLVNDTTPEIRVEYSDGGSGIDTDSLQVLLDAVDLTAGCTVSAASATCETAQLGAGEHTVSAQISDLAGNPATAVFTFELLVGDGPHTVRFPALADTYLKSGSPNQSQGSETFLRLRQSGSNRALVRFEMAEVSAVVGGAEVISATLVLEAESNGNNWGPDGRTVDAHRLSAGWTEAGATWNCAADADPVNQQPDCAAPWSGGSFEGEPAASVLHTGDLLGPARFDVTGDVVASLAGAEDHGWLLKKTEEGQSGLVEYTSREGTAGQGPALELVFAFGDAADVDPPLLRLSSPAQSVVVNDPTPLIALEYSDAGVGIDLASLQVRLDGSDLTAGCSLGSLAASCEPPPLGAGRHTIEAELSDLNGNTAMLSFSFDLLLGGGALSATFPAIADTYLKNGTPNQNQGGESFLRVRQSGKNRALVRFDQAEIAAAVGDGTLISASLELFIESNGNNWGGTGRTVGAHRLSAAWTELGATWNCPDDADPADSSPDCALQWAGGSFEPAATDTVLHTNGLTDQVRFDVTSDVASWVDATLENHGWLLKKTEEGQSGLVKYISKEGVGQVPQLIVVFEPDDTVAPEINITNPSEPVFFGELILEIQVEYTDAASGIDLSSLSILLDGTDLTASCNVGAASAGCEPLEIAAGTHTVSAAVSDRAGNTATDVFDFELITSTDAVAPTLVIFAPNVQILDDTTPEIQVRYSDDDSGISLSSFRLTLDGADLTPACSVDATSASCESPEILPGIHTLRAQISDRAGNLAVVDGDFELIFTGPDDLPPALVIVAPAASALIEQPQPEIVLEYADDEAGVDLDTLVVRLDGQVVSECAVGAALTTCTPPPLADGAHTLVVELADTAGNLAQASSSFDVLVVPPDLTPPVVLFTAPAEVQVSEGTTIELAAQYSDTGSGIDLPTLRVSVAGAELTDNCSADLAAVTCAPIVLEPGLYLLSAVIHDLAGNAGSAELTLTVLPETQPPRFFLDSPSSSLVVGDATPAIVLAYADGLSGIDLASLRVELDGSDLLALCTVGPASAVCEPPSLVQGLHTLEAGIRDRRGNEATVRFTFEISLSLDIAITAPVAGLLSNAERIEVRGTVSPLAEQVSVEGIEAALDGSTFVAADVPLEEGANVLTAAARTAGGGIGTATVTVVRDTTAPRAVLRFPRDGFATSSTVVTITGELVDPASSSTERALPEVSVNGVAAQVSEQGSFMVEDFLLLPGQNVLTATATDAVGNSRSEEVTVTVLGNPTARIEEIRGNNQSAPAGAPLEQPLVVRLGDAFGVPLAGRTVRFEVTRGSGQVLNFPAQDRVLTVTSDEQGLAEVRFLLGKRAGFGNHEVTVTSPGVPGAVVFCASAGLRSPQRIQVIAGSNALGALAAAAGQPAPFPLLAQVFDEVGNPMPGVPVTYRVVAGDGRFDGAASAVATTDAAGKAAASLTLDPEPGVNNNVVEATFPGLAERPAVFTLSGLEVGPEAATSLTGLVLDNLDEPLPGVTVSIADTGLETVTDGDGRFTLDGVPVGDILLDVDGGTTLRAGTWPHLEYAFSTISGQASSLGMPIRLLPLDTENARLVGGDEDVTLTLGGVAGAELTVFANSVRFPGGSETGLLSLTQVPGDKVPMLAPMGSNFMLAWTIQPPGVTFDPPARISIPNMGEPPGTVVDMFSFDHDLGEFVAIGTASVTADGSRLVSNPGTGVLKSGWHGCVPAPDDPADSCQPGACKKCEPGNPRPVDKCPDKCQTCKLSCPLSAASSLFAATKACTGSCQQKSVDEVKVQVDGEEKDEVLAALNEELQFLVTFETTCTTPEFEWSFDDSSGGSDLEDPTHTYTTPKVYDVSVKVSCEDCDQVADQPANVKVVATEIEVLSLSPQDEFILGEPLSVEYEIKPADGTYDRVELRILNSDDDVLYRRTDLPAKGGMNSTEWKGELNEPGVEGAFANPKGGDYKVVVAAVKGEKEVTSEDDKTIRTRLVVEAKIEDKPAAGQESGGLRDLESVLEVVFRLGNNDAETFTGSDLNVTPEGTKEQVKKIKIDNDKLKSLADGEYKVLFRNLRDDIGNFSDEDENTNDIEPLEKTLKLMSKL